MLGALDLDEFAFQNLRTLQDWERNFKAVKARGRDAEKLPKYLVLIMFDVVVMKLGASMKSLLISS